MHIDFRLKYFLNNATLNNLTIMEQDTFGRYMNLKGLNVLPNVEKKS